MNPSNATLRAKWRLFRLLERMSELRAAPEAPAPVTGKITYSVTKRALWVYVSTIGELNAIEPFLLGVLARLKDVPLLLLTDHPHYRESFLAKYPDAHVAAVDHRSATALELEAAYPPRLLIIAEIPCRLSDAPCRLPFAFVYQLAQRSVPVCLVNGWLYHQAPTCAMDAIEKRLFDADYLRLMTLITVQDAATRNALIAAGAHPDRVVATGNTKFDAIGASTWDPERGKSPLLLRSIASQPRPTIVAGCVTNISEQELALDAFQMVRTRLQGALLVLAPRHTEAVERMRKLRELLAARGIPYAFKSELGDRELPASIDCLVLDTMGELKDFYAAGDIAYVGLNHNVLEPLCFGKPVVVTPGWNPIYPSYPVYGRLVADGVISQVEQTDLAAEWLRLLQEPDARTGRPARIAAMLEGCKGAADRDIQLMAQLGLFQPPAAGIGKDLRESNANTSTLGA